MTARIPKEALAKGKHGGARPGAGRKPKSVIEEQECRRDTILRVITDQRWEKIVTKAATLAEEGDPVARQWLTPYVAGKVPDEIRADVNVSGGVTIYLPERKAE